MRGPGLITQVRLHLTTGQGQSSMAVDGLAQHTALLPTHMSPIAKGLAEINRKDRSSEFRLCFVSWKSNCHGPGDDFFNIKMATPGPVPEDRGCRWSTLPGECVGLSCPVQRYSHSPVAFCPLYAIHTAPYTDLKSMLTSFN